MSTPEFPTMFESPIPIEDSNQTSLIGASAFCIIFPTLMVTLRMVAKIKSTKKFNSSDACILVALFFNTALHADVFIMVAHGGFGFHVQQIAMRFGPEVLTLFFKINLRPTNSLPALFSANLTSLQCIMVFALLWNATTCFTKLSVLLMYMSVFPVRRVVLPCQVLGVFIILWNIGGVLGGILVCRPLAMNWDQTIPGGKCGNQPMYYMWLGIINIIVEVTMLALPMPVLYKLQMPLRKKIVIISMFGIGFATCAITIYRQATLPALQFADMTHSGVVATLLSGLEPSVALALACVPFLRPLFGTVFGTTQNKSSAATGDYRKGSKRSVTREFEELDDNSSEVQLQPFMPIREALVTSDPKKRNKTAKPDTITVETGWEVNVKRDSGGPGLK